MIIFIFYIDDLIFWESIENDIFDLSVVSCSEGIDLDQEHDVVRFLAGYIEHDPKTRFLNLNMTMMALCLNVLELQM